MPKIEYVIGLMIGKHGTEQETQVLYCADYAEMARTYNLYANLFLSNEATNSKHDPVSWSAVQFDCWAARMDRGDDGHLTSILQYADTTFSEPLLCPDVEPMPQTADAETKECRYCSARVPLDPHQGRTSQSYICRTCSGQRGLPVMAHLQEADDLMTQHKEDAEPQIVDLSGWNTELN